MLRLVGIGYHPEPALLQQGQLVVVVEHDGPVAGHPEVLGEQVARPNVGCGQVLDGPTPVDGRGLGPVGLHFLQVQVQRVHLAFGIGVADHYLVADQLDRLSGLVEQFLEQVRVEPVPVERQVLKLLGVDHPTDPVTAVHKFVAALYGLARGVLGRVETVLDDLKHHVERDQGEHGHDHSGRAAGPHELVGRGLEVPVEGAVEAAFAVLRIADGRVELVERLGGEQ